MITLRASLCRDEASPWRFDSGVGCSYVMRPGMRQDDQRVRMRLYCASSRIFRVYSAFGMMIMTMGMSCDTYLDPRFFFHVPRIVLSFTASIYCLSLARGPSRQQR